MRRILMIALIALFMTACAEAEDVGPVGIAIHGGAGTMDPEDMDEEREAEYHAALEEALEAGHEVLADGGESLDAVQAAIRVLEDEPLFNAGRGSVFTSDGENELDAALMDGRDLNAGAVAGVRKIRNPIDLTRLIMDESPHVLFSGAGAERFAENFEDELEFVDPEFFHTDHRWEQLQEAQREEAEQGGEFRSERNPGSEHALGTVGAVALDAEGNLAAGTSTGGMTNKRFGRIGDVPILGSGTYANNETAALSATGHGEYIMRAVTLHDISSVMMYGEKSLEEAADYVVNEKLVDMGGNAGVIAIDGEGNITMPFNTSGMYRGSIDVDGNVKTAIFAE